MTLIEWIHYGNFQVLKHKIDNKGVVFLVFADLQEFFTAYDEKQQSAVIYEKKFCGSGGNIDFVALKLTKIWHP